MKYDKDLTKYKFGKLTTIKISYINKNHVKIWECKCDCVSWLCAGGDLVVQLLNLAQKLNLLQKFNSSTSATLATNRC